MEKWEVLESVLVDGFVDLRNFRDEVVRLVAGDIFHVTHEIHEYGGGLVFWKLLELVRT